MVIKEVTQIGNPIITTISSDVADVHDPAVREIIQNLKDSLEFNELIGIAAPQIGHNVRIFVTEIRATPARPNQEADIQRVYINPVITWKSDEMAEIWEGCGSVAEGQLFAPIMRSKEIEIEALDENGKKFSLKADGLLARCIQHEYDHLEGKVFAFYIDDMRTIMSKREYKERIGKTRKD